LPDISPTSIKRAARPLEAQARTHGKLSFWPLVIATFFMVSGGTYGTEDIVHSAGYGMAILILLLTPLVWSVPTALMIGELSSALPQEGGYYVWVRRAMGDFWGFQEAWLSLAASVFDLAIYPALFVLYLARLYPWVGTGYRGLAVGVVVVVACAVLNIAGI
jgi:amino acid transporter